MSVAEQGARAVMYESAIPILKRVCDHANLKLLFPLHLGESIAVTFLVEFRSLIGSRLVHGDQSLFCQGLNARRAIIKNLAHRKSIALTWNAC